MRPGIVHVPPPDPASAQAQPNPEKRKILSNNTFASLVYGESPSASWRTRNDHPAAEHRGRDSAAVPVVRG